jgi:flagellar basal-body rod protein FlgB
MRQAVLTSNIANAETPGFKAKRLDFEGAFQRALDLQGKRQMASSSESHYSTGGGGPLLLSPQVYNDPNGVIKEDGNTVDREAEMSKLAQNQILYSSTVQMLNKKLALQKYVIEEGNESI